MYTSPAKLLNEIGMETEFLRSQKKPDQKLSMFCDTPLGVLKVYYLKASEDLITLMGLIGKTDTHYFLTPSSLRLVVILEPLEPGTKEKQIVIEGFKLKSEASG